MLFPIMFPQVPSEHDGHERRAAEEFALASTHIWSGFCLSFLENLRRLNLPTGQQLLAQPELLHQHRWGCNQNLSDHLFTASGVTTTGDEDRWFECRSRLLWLLFIAIRWDGLLWWTARRWTEVLNSKEWRLQTRLVVCTPRYAGIRKVESLMGTRHRTTGDRRGISQESPEKGFLSSRFRAPSTDTLGLHDWKLRLGSRSLEKRKRGGKTALKSRGSEAEGEESAEDDANRRRLAFQK